MVSYPVLEMDARDHSGSTKIGQTVIVGLRGADSCLSELTDVVEARYRLPWLTVKRNSQIPETAVNDMYSAAKSGSPSCTAYLAASA